MATDMVTSLFQLSAVGVSHAARLAAQPQNTLTAGHGLATPSLSFSLDLSSPLPCHFRVQIEAGRAASPSGC